MFLQTLHLDYGALDFLSGFHYRVLFLIVLQKLHLQATGHARDSDESDNEENERGGGFEKSRRNEKIHRRPVSFYRSAE